MPETEYKQAGGSTIFAPEDHDARGSLPAHAAAATARPILNPGPKAALLGLALLVMAGFAHFMPGLPGLTTPPTSVSVPPTPPQATTQAPPQAANPPASQTNEAATQEPTQQSKPQIDEAAAQAHREKIARLARTPRQMSARSFENDNLDGLSLQNSTVSKAAFRAVSLRDSSFNNMRITGCVFTDVDFSKANIREVNFEDCTFEDTAIDEALFFNVNFINCAFIGTKWEQGVSKARVAGSRMYDVSFENAELQTFELFLNSGRVTFKDTDLTSLRLSSDGNNKYFPAISSGTTQFRLNLENCTGGDLNFELRSVSSELKITGGDLDNIRLSSFSKIEITNSRVTGRGFIEARDWLVIKNSTLCANFRSYGPMYLLGNSYIGQRAASQVNAFLKDGDGLYNTTTLRPANGAPCYIAGGADDAWLSTFGGAIHIADLKIRMGYFELDNSTHAPSELNMKNVTLDKAHIYNSDLHAAYWENVKILNPMTSRNIRNQRPLTVRMSNVTLPEGAPWIDSPLYSVEQAASRPWPRPEIPELK